MRDKILALLIAKFAGVRKDGLAQLAASMSLQAEKEEDATAIVERLTLEKVDDFVKDWRKDVDKEVSESNRTYEGNLKKKYDFVEKKGKEPGKDPDPNKSTDPTDIASIVNNAVMAAVEPLQQKLASFESGKTAEARLQLLQGKFKDKNLPETFTSQKVKDFKRINFESEEAFAEYLNELDTDIAAFNQELADKGLSGQSKPLFGSKTADGVSSSVKEFVEGKSEGSGALTGKEI